MNRPGSRPGLRIGEAAERAGVSARTLRYYEELGLLPPSARTPGGARRYTEPDIGRLAHIRELQELMGFNLDEIRSVVSAEDRLATLRQAYFSSTESPERQVEILREAMVLNARLRERVEAKKAGLDRMLAQLESKHERYIVVLDALNRGEPPPPPVDEPTAAPAPGR
jgi:DNA-binding transcriptional MerR regulator